MAALSLYDTKSFLNHRRKSPVNFPVEQNNLSAMRVLLERAAPVLNRGRTVHGTSLVLRRANSRKDAISARKTGQSCANASSGWQPLKPLGHWRCGPLRAAKPARKNYCP
jgi:hypothetical protein